MRACAHPDERIIERYECLKYQYSFGNADYDFARKRLYMQSCSLHKLLMGVDVLKNC